MSVNISGFSTSPFAFVYFLFLQRTYSWFPVSTAFSLYARGQNDGFGTEILEFMGTWECFLACSFHTFTVCVISGFCHEVADKCALLSYYAATSGNFLEITASGYLITKKKAVFTFTLWLLNVFLFIFVFREEIEEFERFWHVWRGVEQLGLVLANHVNCKELNSCGWRGIALCIFRDYFRSWNKCL